jgi:PAS domain S-box-containing protein
MRKPTKGSAVNQLEYERLSLSFKAMGGGLWDYDIDADVLFCNERWYEILGLDQATHPITSIEAFKPYIHPDDLEIATRIDDAEVSELLAKNEYYRVEFRIVRPSGETRWLRSVACLILDSSSHHRRAIGCVTDITEFRTTGAGEATRWPDAPDKPASTRKTLDAPRSESIGIDLTDKERECLKWVSAGKTAGETAAIIGRSARTVEFHLRNATRKLNATNKVHAATIAIRLNLL